MVENDQEAEDRRTVFLGHEHSNKLPFPAGLAVLNRVRQMLVDISAHTGERLAPPNAMAFKGMHIGFAIAGALLCALGTYEVLRSSGLLRYGLILLSGIFVFWVLGVMRVQRKGLFLGLLGYVLIFLAGSHTPGGHAVLAFVFFLWMFAIAPYTRIAGVLHDHFRAETGTLVADPDAGLEATALQFMEDELLGVRYCFQVPVERSDFRSGFFKLLSISVGSHYHKLNNVLSRHWAFHERNQPAQIKYIRTGRIKDLSAASAIMLMVGYLGGGALAILLSLLLISNIVPLPGKH